MKFHQTFGEINELLDIYFKGDQKKVAVWLKCRNPNLGGISPLDMITAGQGQRLIDFITQQGKENGWLDDV